MIPLLFALSARTALSQSTIFTVPTADTVTKGNVYSEFDYVPRSPNQQRLDRIDVMIPRVIVGVSNNIEIGANVVIQRIAYTPRFTIPPVSHELTNPRFEPNMKWKFASNTNLGIAASDLPREYCRRLVQRKE